MGIWWMQCCTECRDGTFTSSDLQCDRCKVVYKEIRSQISKHVSEVKHVPMTEQEVRDEETRIEDALTNKTKYSCFLRDIRNSGKLKLMLKDFLSHCEEKPGTYMVIIEDGNARIGF